MERHVSLCVTVEKHIKKKITETEQKEEQKKETEGKKTF